MSAADKQDEVPLKRDENWWLHPAYRGEQALPLGVNGGLPHRWVRTDAPPERTEVVLDDDSAFADLAQVLYRLNGARPGPVHGFYVVVAVAAERFAVGQLCADPVVPVQLFEDHVYPTETQARDVARALRADDLPRSSL